MGQLISGALVEALEISVGVHNTTSVRTAYILAALLLATVVSLHDGLAVRNCSSPEYADILRAKIFLVSFLFFPFLSFPQHLPVALLQRPSGSQCQFRVAVFPR